MCAVITSTIWSETLRTGWFFQALISFGVISRLVQLVSVGGGDVSGRLIRLPIMIGQTNRHALIHFVFMRSTKAIFSLQVIRDDVFFPCFGRFSHDMTYEKTADKSPTQKATHSATNSGLDIDMEFHPF